MEIQRATSETTDFTIKDECRDETRRATRATADFTVSIRGRSIDIATDSDTREVHDEVYRSIINAGTE